MAVKENLVGWHAALYIWAAQVWRIALVSIGIIIIAGGIKTLMPVFYFTLQKASFDHSQATGIIEFLFNFYVSLWALRKSLSNGYATFNLTVQNKETNRTLFRADKQLPWGVVLNVWWAQYWRSFLVTIALIIAMIASALARHQDPSFYLFLTTNKLIIGLDTALTLLTSIWATHESLADRYRVFRFAAAARTFYGEGGQP